MTERVGEVHHIGICVRDLPLATAFVRDVLGLRVDAQVSSEEHRMRATFFDGGPVSIELVQFTDPGTVARKLGSDAPAVIDHVALRVGDLDRVVRDLDAAGVAMTTPEPVALPSGRMLFTRSETSGGVTWQLLEPAGSTPSGDAATDAA
jgi:catechol 2,3-dioxygenase-like lactoylglutathione lyase family enzyme